MLFVPELEALVLEGPGTLRQMGEEELCVLHQLDPEACLLELRAALEFSDLVKGPKHSVMEGEAPHFSRPCVHFNHLSDSFAARMPVGNDDIVGFISNLVNLNCHMYLFFFS